MIDSSLLIQTFSIKWCIIDRRLVCIFMSDKKPMKWPSATNIFIEHLLEGKYLSEEKVLLTKFGKIKKAKIIATIVEKKEFISDAKDDKNNSTDSEPSNSRIAFDLDDGTGLIRANVWRADPEKYSTYDKGDIVIIVGGINQYKEFISISLDIIRKVEDPNYILLFRAEVLKKFKLGNWSEIPEVIEPTSNIDEISSNFEVKEMFEHESDSNADDLKEKVFKLIESHTTNGKGIKFEKMKTHFKVTDEDLRTIIRDLEMESKIYKAEEDTYQSY